MRARNIKPGFLKNEDLIELDPLVRILFAGLWMMADREGRLEDRPKKIKIEILPGDNCDVNEMLDQLAGRAFIIRYEVEGKRYIQVEEFLKHQHPHKEEKQSVIPKPVTKNTMQAPCLHQTSTGETPCKHHSNPADSLIPDSLIPDPPMTATFVAEGDLTDRETIEDFKQSHGCDPGWLARQWVNVLTAKINRCPRDKVEDVFPQFAEWIRIGLRPQAIEAEIKDPARDKSEHLWQMKNRLLKNGVSPPGKTLSIEDHIRKNEETIRRITGAK